MARIIETDMYGGDYPNESFILWGMSKEDATDVAAVINKVAGSHSNRYWRVVGNDYKLQPGFEP